MDRPHYSVYLGHQNVLEVLCTLPQSVGKVCNQNSGTTRFNERSGDLEVTVVEAQGRMS